MPLVYVEVIKEIGLFTIYITKDLSSMKFS